MGVKLFSILTTARKREPLTMTALTDCTGITLRYGPTRPRLHYRIGTSGAWQAYSTSLAIPLAQGEILQWWNEENFFSSGTTPLTYSRFESGAASDRIAMSGDILSLINWRQDLPDYCFYGLFQNNKGIVNSPIFPDVLMGKNSLQRMFMGATNLKEIHVAFTEWPETATSQWIVTVPGGGTFYKPSSLPEKFGSSYIPSGWAVVNID